MAVISGGQKWGETCMVDQILTIILSVDLAAISIPRLEGFLLVSKCCQPNISWLGSRQKPEACVTGDLIAESFPADHKGEPRDTPGLVQQLQPLMRSTNASTLGTCIWGLPSNGSGSHVEHFGIVAQLMIRLAL